MPARWGDKIPHVADAGDGTDAWYVFGRRISSLTGFSFVQGVTPDRGVVTRWADVPKIAYVPAERVKAMDSDGIDAHSFYPNIGNVQTLNNPEVPEALRLDALRACNAVAASDASPPRWTRVLVRSAPRAIRIVSWTWLGTGSTERCTEAGLSGRSERRGAVEAVDCGRIVDARPGALGRPKSGSPDEISPTGPIVCRES